MIGEFRQTNQIFWLNSMAALFAHLRNRWRRSLVAAVLGAGLIAAILGGSFVRPTPTYTVQNGEILHRFVAQGRVECQQTVEVVPEVSAAIRTICVNEGDQVEQGQLLIELDDASLSATHLEAVHAAAMAKAKWDQLKRGAREEEIEAADAQVEMLQGQYEAALSRERELLRGPREQVIEQAKQATEAAKSEADNALRQYERMVEANVGSAAELDDFRFRSAAARAMHRAREAELNLLVAGASDEEKAQAKATVKSAMGRLKSAQAELKQLKAGATAEELAAAEAAYQQAEDAVERTRILLSNTKITSPMTGVVLRRFHHPGELVHPQIPQPILVLCDDAPRELRVEIMEGDVYKLGEGQAVAIKSESHIGQRWQGRISRISPLMGRKRLMSEGPKEKTDVKVLEAWVLPDTDLHLPINAPVEVSADFVIRQDVPVIPWRCIQLPDHTVTMANGSVRTVQLGARDDGYVEVLSGLALGDRIRLPER
jgi:multidrug resistance efflux pump